MQLYLNDLKKIFLEGPDKDELYEHWAYDAINFKISLSELIEKEIAAGKRALGDICRCLININDDIYMDMLKNQKALYICYANNMYIVLSLDGSILFIHIVSEKAIKVI